MPRDVHIMPGRSHWTVVQDGRPPLSFETKDEAIRAATKRAARDRVSMVLHDETSGFARIEIRRRAEDTVKYLQLLLSRLHASEPADVAVLEEVRCELDDLLKSVRATRAAWRKATEEGKWPGPGDEAEPRAEPRTPASSKV
jgi:hypothetical protein